MNNFKYLVPFGFMMLLSISCSGGPTKHSEWVIPDTDYPLSEPGPYFVGVQEITIVDESRGGREIELTIWYPAKEKTDALSMRDAPANRKDAPYPLILTDYATEGELIEDHLATHGFVMVGVQSPDEYANWDFGVIDHPRDILFALEQIAANPPEGLNGIIDSDHVAVTGYSWGGLYSLVLSGARLHPEYYLSYCKQAQTMQPALEEWYIRYTCDLASKWEGFAAHAGNEITSSDDGLWQPLADERIRAVMPMGPDGAWLFGKRGLAAVDRPTLIIGGTADEISPYKLEAAYIFENLGTPDRFLVSFIGKTHFMVEEPQQIERIHHFATAFFGYYLHGREDFAYYFSEEFVSQQEGLAWGVHEE